MSHPEPPAPPVHAHSLENRPPAEWELLIDHLRAVATLAGSFGTAFGAGEWGHLAGLWHDLGKYRPEFQRRLRGEAIAVEHAGAGAALAQQRLPEVGVALAFVIAGHHAGLANLQKSETDAPTPLRERLRANAPRLAEILPLLPPELLEIAPPVLPERFRTLLKDDPEGMAGFAFWIRFLFSALVDADRLATEQFYHPGERAGILTGFADIPTLGQRLEAHLGTLVGELSDEQRRRPVNRLRAEVLAACRAAADRPPGLFSLTVPTGGGKTLSAMAFALEHARRHGLSRVIAAIPYTSIIEQNADVYRKALGAENVIEHHSALDPELADEASREVERRRALAAENWDAPVIVTTNVQLFESLFTHRTGRVRKVHRIAGSVLLLDEAQSLPAGMLLPVLDALRELTAHYGCSVVLSTATQPALGQRQALPQGLEGVREIIPEPGRLARDLRRVRVCWPALDAPPTPYRELAEELLAHPRVLAVVHRRADARLLAELLPEKGRFHLSALMCPAHRKAVLERLKERLAGGGPCRLVSTQLIEAGVDVDFPVVYRALAGLDSLAQAAGRCNREGHLGDLGSFHIFRAETDPPPGLPQRGLEVTESLLREHGGELDLVNPELFASYFRHLYHTITLDAKAIQGERAELNFATVGRLFQLIDDRYASPIVVPWGKGTKRLETLRSLGPNRERLRALQAYTVNVPKRTVEIWQRDGVVVPVAETVLALSPPFAALYSEEFGLTLDVEARADAAGLVL